MRVVPRSGPIWLDGRALDPTRLLLRIRQTVRGIRRGARELRVVGCDADAVQAVHAWARAHGVATVTERRGDVQTVHAYLLPMRFGEPPEASWREFVQLAPSAMA